MDSKRRAYFLFFALVVGFFISAEYGATRPVSHALFLSVFSSQIVPWAWLAIIPLNFVVVSCYNRFLPRIGPMKMIWIIGALIMAINFVSALSLRSFPQWIFFQFVWKDIYILLMFKQLWSMIHTTIDPGRAKYLYGLFFGIGAIGAIGGNQIPAYFAVLFGSETLFFLTLPFYLILLLAYSAAYRYSGLQGKNLTSSAEEPFRESWAMLRSSSYLKSLLFLVIFMQMVSALFEYQFNWHLERMIQDKDLLAAYCGRLMGIINCINGALQFAGVFLIVRVLGLRNAHLLVPMVLWVSAFCSWFFPYFTMISLSFITVKSMDYSLFGVLRELLYPALKTDEKFRAKALIDVFAHRTSKSTASLLILLLQGIAGIYLLPLLTCVALLLCSLWIAVVYFMFKKYEQTLSPRITL